MNRLRTSAGCVGAAVLVAALCPALRAQPETSVGITGTLEGVVLPGSELEVKPPDDRKSPLVLRVARVYPHGTAFRYDLEYFGLEPGTYDLRAQLRRKDGSPVGALPPMSVTVTPARPPGQVLPNKLEIEPGPRVGGYRWLAAGVVAVWALGLVALVASFFFPRRRKAVGTAERPATLADRLKPLLEGAVAGTLSRAELAGLERGLLAYWRKRLNLEGAEPAAALAQMRAHPDAGPLLAELEAWLHRPGAAAPVDVPALLAPYRALPAEAIDLAGGAP
jgi:hypothetical protein